MIRGQGNNGSAGRMPEERSRQPERKGIRNHLRNYVERLSKAMGFGKAGEIKAAPAGNGTKERAGQAGPSARKPAAMEAADVELRPAGPPTSRDMMFAAPPPSPQPAPAYIERGPELPAGYAEDRIEALVRDPRCVFVYWELGGGGCERVWREHDGAELAAGRWALRVEHHAGEGSEPGSFDVTVDPGAGNWYLHVEPSTQYRVRIGVILPSGVFVELAASQTVATPPEFVSERVDEQWMMASDEFERLTTRILWSGLAGSSGMVHRRAVELPRRLRLFSAGVSSRR